MSLAQGNNTPTRPRIEPGSPDPESNALTTRSVRSPIWGMRTKSRRYCTRYKKVLYNIKKIKKKCGWGGGGVAIFEPKTLSMYSKKKKKKKLTEPGFEPTTSGFEIHLAKHYYIAITKYE